MTLLCAICTENTVRKGLFCKSCYETYKQDIYDNKEWVKVCKSFEEKRRRTEAKERNLIYLGDDLDINDSGKIVYRD